MEKHILRFTEVLMHIRKTWKIHTDIRNGEVCGGEFEITVGQLWITSISKCWKWNSVGHFPTITARCKKCMTKGGTVWEFPPKRIEGNYRITDRAYTEGECKKRDDGSYVQEIPF